MTIAQQILQTVESMDDARQRRVLDFARSISEPPSRAERQAAIAALMGSIPAEDLRAMQAAIEAECERVDEDGW